MNRSSGRFHVLYPSSRHSMRRTIPSESRSSDSFVFFDFASSSFSLSTVVYLFLITAEDRNVAWRLSFRLSGEDDGLGLLLFCFASESDAWDMGDSSPLHHQDKKAASPLLLVRNRRRGLGLGGETHLRNRVGTTDFSGKHRLILPAISTVERVLQRTTRESEM